MNALFSYLKAEPLALVIALVVASFAFIALGLHLALRSTGSEREQN